MEENTMATKTTVKKPLINTGATDEERAKALATAKQQLTKRFGEGIIMKLGENTHMTVQAVHTGSLSLDLALGIGGDAAVAGKCIDFGNFAVFFDFFDYCMFAAAAANY